MYIGRHLRWNPLHECKSNGQDRDCRSISWREGAFTKFARIFRGTRSKHRPTENSVNFSFWQLRNNYSPNSQFSKERWPVRQFFDNYLQFLFSFRGYNFLLRKLRLKETALKQTWFPLSQSSNLKIEKKMNQSLTRFVDLIVLSVGCDARRVTISEVEAEIMAEGSILLVAMKLVGWVCHEEVLLTWEQPITRQRSTLTSFL